MRYILPCILTLLPLYAAADTIDHYMHISSNIPTMEMKADPDAQTWARSARNVLTITNESIAETLIEANVIAQNQGAPLFCLPKATNLDASTLKSLIEQAYQQMPRTQSDKDKMTVSQVAWLAVTQQFPCASSKPIGSSNVAQSMQHAEG